MNQNYGRSVTVVRGKRLCNSTFSLLYASWWFTAIYKFKNNIIYIQTYLFIVILDPFLCTKDDQGHLSWLICDNPNLLRAVQGECSDGTPFQDAKKLLDNCPDKVRHINLNIYNQLNTLINMCVITSSYLLFSFMLYFVVCF